MTPHDLTLSALQREGVLRACAAYNAALPRDPQGVLLEGQVELTPDAYFDARVIGMADSWAQQHCSCSGFDLSRRFTTAEYAAILERAKTDPHVAGFVARLSDPTPINPTSPRFWEALAYLVAVGLLAEDRVDEIAGISGDAVTIAVAAVDPLQSATPSIWRRLFGWMR
jgi:hypothetical protein